MVSAVIWDFGGVITTSPFEAFNRYEAERNIPRDTIRTINATNPDNNAWARFERSEITAAEFDNVFADEAKERGYTIPGADVIALLSGDVRPEMVIALERISETLKTGCITNNVNTGKGPGMAVTSEKAAAVQEAMDLFHHVIESSKVGIRKPDPKIYQMMCDALEIEASDAVYLDDLGINCKPARALGMTTIKVVSADQALQELEAATGMDLR